MEDRIRELINKLNEAAYAYDEGKPFISDKEYDKMWFELKELQEETGIVYNDSPVSSIPYQMVTELKKVKHNHPMLSLDKTKDLTVVESFLKGHDWIAMAKMDGLTCSLRYLDGKLISAETRGNGTIGEDITHNAMVIPSIPKVIPYKEEVIIDGEIICTYKDFEQFKNEYKNPRNFAAGSIRLLDSKECYKRHLTFVAWDVVKGGPHKYLSQNLTWAITQGFYTVPKFINKDIELIEVVGIIKDRSNYSSYPIDGIVFKYDNIEEYNKAGRTDHHFKGGLAYKFYDEIYKTKLKNIEWTMGRTGQLTPVAIYDDIEIDGSICSRASLHNVTVMLDQLYKPYKNETISICKMNQIIPQVIDNEWNEDEYYKNTPLIIPSKCPYCGEPTEIIKDNDSEVLYCTNINCNTRLINRLDHFVGKKGLDIKGLSKATLEKLINWGWVIKIEDLFLLKNYREEWINKSGFGITSVDKILNAIENGKICTFSSFLCAIGIPLIGKVASKTLEKEFITYSDFRNAIDQKDGRLYHLEGIGEVMIEKLLNFNYNEADALYKWIVPLAAIPSSNDTVLKNKVFCITGKIKNWKNRDELKSFIESKGGKVTSSVTSKTSYLINNDTSSKTAKNLTAIKLKVPIINEDEFLTLVTPPNENIEPNYIT